MKISYLQRHFEKHDSLNTQAYYSCVAEMLGWICAEASGNTDVTIHSPSYAMLNPGHDSRPVMEL